MNKIITNTIFVMCMLGILITGVYSLIKTGYSFVIMYTEMGLTQVLICFIIGSIFYAMMFYGLYRLDLKVRKIIMDEKKKELVE